LNKHVRNLLLVMCLLVTISLVTFSYAAFSQELMITGGEAYIEASTDKKLTSYISSLVKSRDDVENVGNAIRYVGSNPKNYVYYNGELWRILGVFDVQTEDGVQKLTKLIRPDPVEIMSWDGGAYNNGNGKNDYANSRILSYLYNNFYYKSYNQWCTYTCFNGTNYDHTFICSYKGLNGNAASMVQKVYWNLGSTNPYEIGIHDVFTPAFLLQSENSSALPNSCSPIVWGTRCTENDQRVSSVHTYVGLPYPSDIGYAAGSICAENKFGNECYDVSWTSASGPEWTITPSYSTRYGDSVIAMYRGSLMSEPAANNYGIRPTLYLKNEVIRKSGSGSQDDPILLGYNGPIGIEAGLTNYAPNGEDVSYSETTDPTIEVEDPDNRTIDGVTVSPVITSIESWQDHYSFGITITNNSGKTLDNWTVKLTFNSNITVHVEENGNVLSYIPSQANGILTDKYIKVNSINRYNNSEKHSIQNGGTYSTGNDGVLYITSSTGNVNINDIISSIDIVNVAESLE